MKNYPYFCHMRIKLILLFCLITITSNAKTWQVGPTRTYTSPSKVSSLVSDGDTVAIDSAAYLQDVCKWTANNLTFIGIGGKAILDAQGTSYGGKAIWEITGNNTTVQNITFANCRCASWNGAGIRQEGNNLTIRNCYFHDNEDGILGGGDSSSTVTIEYSEFFHNGHGDGYSHNLYIANIKKLIFEYNYSHTARIGHELKSRAFNNYILYNRFSDEDTGSTSRNIDLPNGGRAILIGNLIEQGPMSQNSNFMEYGLEGLKNPDSNIYLINNTFVNDLGKGSFLIVQPGTKLCKMYNNIFAGTGTVFTGPATTLDTSNNLITLNLRLIYCFYYDYHLLSSSPALDKGTAPGNDGMFSLTPTYQYKHPANGEIRPSDGKLDIGAYEYGTVVAGIAETEKNILNFSVYPNPSKGNFTVNFYSAINEKSTIEIVDLNGRILFNKVLEKDVDNLNFSMENLKAGLYFVKVMGGNSCNSSIVIIEK